MDGPQSTVKARKVGSPVPASSNPDAALFYDQFRRHAQRFVSLVERGEALPTRSFLVEVATALAELCAVALTLPDIESETHTKPDVEIATPSIVETLRNRLGKADEHWEVFDPTKKDEPLKRSLAEDIANIYGDLKRGLLLTAHGASTSEVLSHWRQAFSTHWGMHATGAMRAIYWALHHHTIEVDTGSLASGSPQAFLPDIVRPGVGIALVPLSAITLNSAPARHDDGERYVREQADEKFSGLSLLSSTISCHASSAVYVAEPRHDYRRRSCLRSYHGTTR